MTSLFNTPTRVSNSSSSQSLGGSGYGSSPIRPSSAAETSSSYGGNNNNQQAEDSSIDLSRFFERYLKLSGKREEELHSALALYDVVLNIRSLQMISNGWPVEYRSKPIEVSMTSPDGIKMKYSRPAYSREESRKYMKSAGRAIAVHGKFKAGKTWLLGRLFNIPVLDDHTISTVGVSIILPGDSTLVPEESIAATPEEAKEQKKRRKKLLKKLEKQKRYNNQFFALDVAGGQMPGPARLAADQRATEIFVRDLALALATDVIFVCARFDAPAQQEIQVMWSLLNKNVSNPTNGRRLVVVHNLYEALTPSTLLARIEDLKKVFLDEQEDGDQEMKESFHDAADDSDSDDDDSDGEQDKSKAEEKAPPIAFYETSMYVHVFLVNDKAQRRGDPHWGRKHNTKTLGALRSYLKSVQLQNNRDFVREFETFTNTQLPVYLRDWNHQFRAVIRNDVLVPEPLYRDGLTAPPPASLPSTASFTQARLLPSTDAESETSEVRVDSDVDESESKSALAPPAAPAASASTQERLPGVPKYFSLKSMNFVEGGRVITNDEVEIQGTVEILEDTYRIQVEAPGATLDDVDVIIRDKTGVFDVTVDFRRQQPLLEDKWSGTRLFGKGVYVANISGDKEYTFGRPFDSSTNKFLPLKSAVKLAEGILTLTLPRHRI